MKTSNTADLAFGLNAQDVAMDTGDQLSAETLALVRQTVEASEGNASGSKRKMLFFNRATGAPRSSLFAAIKRRLSGLFRKPAKVDDDAVPQAADAASISRKRPDRIYLFLIAFAVIFFLPVWVVPTVLLFTIMTLAIIYLSLGPDRITEIVLNRYATLKENNPEKAEATRVWAHDFSRRLERLVAKLPESWTQGLYLPTFEEDVDPDEKFAQDPFERLAQQSQAPSV
ncbi:hypothetical protein ACXYMO_05780 [Arenibacterium sp. CAU 1754]